MHNTASSVCSLAPHAAPLAGEAGRLGAMVSKSSHMHEVFGLVETLAASGVPVLIEGERGTGKRALAQEIHLRRARAQGPLLTVRCDEGDAACRARLLSALRDAAPGGTVYLEEVTDLSPRLQADLLSIGAAGLAERAERATEGHASEEPEIQILAATRLDIQSMVRARRFSEDLYHQISWLPVRIPPLRTRTADIELLATHFLARIAWRERQKPPVLSADATCALLSRAWPGNVAELKAAMEHAFRVVSDGVVRAADLPAGPGQPVSLRRATQRDAIEKLERIEAALSASHHDVAAAARALGVSQSTLYRWRRSLALKTR